MAARGRSHPGCPELYTSFKNSLQMSANFYDDFSCCREKSTVRYLWPMGDNALRFYIIGDPGISRPEFLVTPDALYQEGKLTREHRR
jgi:hypothetical protein